MQEKFTEKEKIIERGRLIVLAAPQLYIDVDVEADGIAGYGSMLALGAQSPTGESYYSEFRPAFSDYQKSKRDFCETHGLERERLMSTGKDFLVVMTEFYQWLSELTSAHKKDLVFTAFNASFDWSFVDLYFAKAGIDNPFGKAALDLKSLAIPLTKKWDWKETSKGKLPSIIIPEGDFTHHALEDARYQQKIHFGIAGLLGERDYLKEI